MKHNKSVLIESFEAFFMLLVSKKAQIENGVFFSLNESTSSDESNQKNLITAAFQNQLYQFIKEKDSKIASENGKIAAAQFQEIAYIMVALADEIFLSLDWDGKAYWRQNSLERKLFGTNQSGEKLLINLNTFLKERNAQDNELGLIYLYTISLGFKGKLRYEQDLNFYVQALKERIFYTIYNRSTNMFKEHKKLFDQGEENIAVDKFLQENPMKNLIKLFIGTSGAYLFASQLIWHFETYKIWNMIHEVIR